MTNIFNNIVARHPHSVGLTFSKYGYQRMPPSPRAVAAMAVQYGSQFIDDLSTNLADEYEGYNGANGLLTIVRKKQSKTKQNKAKRNVLTDDSRTVIKRRDIAPMRVTTSQPYSELTHSQPAQLTHTIGDDESHANTFKRVQHDPVKKTFFQKFQNIFNQVLPVAQSVAQAVAEVKNNKQTTTMPNDNTPPQTPINPAKKSKTLLYVGIGIVAVLIVVLIIIKNKKVVK